MRRKSSDARQEFTISETSPTRKENGEDLPANNPNVPLAAIFCSDLMFAVQLQNIARKAGFRSSIARPGSALAPADVLLVNIADTGNWQNAIREAHSTGTVVIAFGPHLDSAGRAQAKAAGANRVLANSNLERDLPGILLELSKSMTGEDNATN